MTLPPVDPGSLPAGPATPWLLLDVGNTATKWAVAAAPPSGPPDAIDPNPPFVASGWLGNDLPDFEQRLLADWIRACTGGGGGAPQPAAVWGCHVARPEVVQRLAVAVAGCGRTIGWLGPEASFALGPHRLDNGYRHPERLGADRWHAMLAARVRWPGAPLVVVNSGTATTVDVVDAEGRFRGGMIAPGVRLMFESLARGTARLPRLDDPPDEHGHPPAAAALAPDAPPPLVLPDNTDDSIGGGVLAAQVGLVAEVAQQAIRSLAVPGAAGALRPRLVFAGGQGPTLARALRSRHPGRPGVADFLAPAELAVDTSLVLRGVWLHALARQPAG